MTDNRIKPFQYEVEEVGRRIKSTKKRYTWALSIDSKNYFIIVDESLVSGKLKLSINGKLFYENQNPILNSTPWQHKFLVDGCTFNILQIGDKLEMRVNNKDFVHMLQQERSEKQFKQHHVEESTFEINKQVQVNSQKVILNLPGMSNGMKKKKNAVQSQNWNSMMGQNSLDSFPNYFGDQKAEECKQQPKCSSQIAISKQAFNTMQSLFKTINNSEPFVPKNSGGNEVETYKIEEIPNVGQMNMNQFNTMQSLFATMKLNPSQKIQEKSQEEEKPKVGLMEEFNTMQNLFTTNCQIQPQKVSIIVEEQQNEQQTEDKPVSNIMDFSTMQNLFQTINPQTNCEAKIENKAQKTNIQSVNLNDFNTMEKLFATNMFANNDFSKIDNQQQKNDKQPEKEQKQPQKDSKKTEVEPIKDINLSNINLNDFNTMQNLFTTQAGTPKSQNVLTSCINNSNNVDLNDFSTMQNLFKTGLNVSSLQQSFTKENN